jgi:hypothetical protein
MPGGLPAKNDRTMTMERVLFWALFVVGMGLAAWLPVQSAFPELGRHLAHVLMIA